MSPSDAALARTNPPAYAWVYGALGREARVGHVAAMPTEALGPHLDAILNAYGELFALRALDATMQRRDGQLAFYVGVRGAVLVKNVTLPGDLLNVFALDEGRAHAVDAWITRVTLERGFAPSVLRLDAGVLAPPGNGPYSARVAAVAEFTRSAPARVVLRVVAPFSERGEPPEGGVAVAVEFARPAGAVHTSLWGVSTGSNDHDAVCDVERRAATQLAASLGVACVEA